MIDVRFLGIVLASLLSATVAVAEQTIDSTTGADMSIASLEQRVSENPDDLELRYDLGIAYNELAMKEDEDALERAIIIMRSITNDDPSHLRAQAMLGSCIVMKAQYASIFSKLDYVKEGYTILDEVLAANPNDSDIRLIRAINSSKSPGFLGRSDLADEDFQWLIDDLKANPDQYDSRYQRTICLYAGEWFLKRREPRSIDYLLKAKTLRGAPRLTGEINEALRRAKKQFPSTYAEKVAR